MGAIGAGSIIGALAGGSLADRFGRRGVMLASLIGYAAVLTFFGYLTSPYAIVTDMAPVAYRARYIGVFTMCFAGANMLGAPLGSLVLGLGGGAVLWGGTLLLGLLSADLYASIHRHIATDRKVTAS